MRIDPDDAFSFDELRIALVAFALWSGVADGEDARELVDEFIEQS